VATRKLKTGTLAAGGQDRAVHIWDSADGRQLAVLRGFAAPVRTVAFSPDGALLAAGSADHTIRVWNAVRHTIVTVLTGGTGTVEDLTFDPGRTVLAAASADGPIRLWDTATGQVDQVLSRAGQPVTSIAFSPDGGMLAAAAGQIITLWDVTNLGRPHVAGELTGATAAVTKLAYSPTGTMVAAEEANGDAVLWNLDLGTRMLLPKAFSGSRGLAFSSEGTILLTAGSYSSLRLWNTASGRPAGSEPRRIPGFTEALAYDPSRGALALGGYVGSVQFWQAPIPRFAGNTAGVTGLALIPRTTMVASVSSDDTLRLWDQDGRLMAAASLGAKPRAVAVSRDGKLLAVAGDDGTASLWAIHGLTPTQRLRLPSAATDVAFSPDGRAVAAAAGATVAIWDTSDGTGRLSVGVSSGKVDAIAFSPDGDDLAAVTNMGTVVIWNARTGRLTARARPRTGPVNTLAFSPDGRLLATAGNDGDINLWDPVNLYGKGVLAGPVGSVEALAFSPDSQTLASGEDNRTILLWDMANRSLTATLTSAPGTVKALAFTPDQGTLISGDSSHRIIAWDLDPATAERDDCLMLGRDPGLNQAETLVPGASYARLCPAGSS
jgi:WD40 repeat protein